jgi:inositol 1,4,5-triphosphate receptor type 1
MKIDGEVVRQRQKLIRNCGLVELLMDMVKSPLTPYNTSPSAITTQDIAKHPEIMDAINPAYDVLTTFLIGESRKNELYMALHIPFIQSQVGRGSEHRSRLRFTPPLQVGSPTEVEDMYTELVRDNSFLIEALTNTEIDFFIESLTRDKNPAYLEFLHALCACEGESSWRTHT